MNEELLLVCTSLTSISGIFILWNLKLFTPLAMPKRELTSSISVLIPARNEEGNIELAIKSVLANRGVDFQIIVGDDGSTDQTATKVKEIAITHPQVSLVNIPPLPNKWVGKQHACHILSQHARHSLLLFMDADVRLKDSFLARIIAHMESHQIDLLSGFPHQQTISFGEKLIIPLIHFLLIGYLPLWGMRHSKLVGFGAACGQLIAVRRQAYDKSGGHHAIGELMHDGLAIPRNFRKAGFNTDVFDASGVASCHMYSNWLEVWRGLSKNATEGMATPTGLPVWTILLSGGHVFSFFLVFLFLCTSTPLIFLSWALLISLFSIAQRLILAIRFNQSFASALLHPFGILVLLGIQWTAFIRSMTGNKCQWRGRSYIGR